VADCCRRCVSFNSGIVSCVCLLFFSSLFVLFSLSKWPLMLDLVFEALLAWLRGNADLVPKQAGGKVTVSFVFVFFSQLLVLCQSLRELASPVAWPDYLSLLERGAQEEKGTFGDYFLLLAFCNVYFINIVCVTDHVVDAPLHPPVADAGLEWTRCCFALTPEREVSSRFAVNTFVCYLLVCSFRFFAPGVGGGVLRAVVSALLAAALL
jgi:hypothetical protein